ncbi:hypothetical protein F0562_008715 [Nyssa sinensis]|uniref:HMA domain-containing protein n=1 Tax=Nyssa sinensis TaxID=561372 RepID=A0A5J5ABE3_9ASTE|nr:hypothetical protein F0562_008715 [Nyssa sinensis]
MKVMEVLSSICGVYSVTIDAAEGTAKVSGEVDPNVLMSALARSGKHAELVWVKLKSGVVSTDHNYHNNEYGYGAINQPYQYRSVALPERSSRYGGIGTHRPYLPRRPVTTEYSSSYTTNYRYLPPSTAVDPPYVYDGHFNCCV